MVKDKLNTNFKKILVVSEDKKQSRVCLVRCELFKNCRSGENRPRSLPMDCTKTQIDEHCLKCLYHEKKSD